MKILIIGEYSGFSNNLAKGFTLIGHKSFVFSWGDVFKKIRQEGDSYAINVSHYHIGKYYLPGSDRLRKIVSAIKLRHYIAEMSRDWNCALIINPSFVRNSGQILDPRPTINQIRRLLKDPNEIYLSACGNDFIFNAYLPHKNKESNFRITKFTQSLTKDQKSWLGVLHNAMGVIPVMLDYAEAYRYFINKYSYHLYKTIPLPFDTNGVDNFNEVNGKIIIMHGVTRPKEKGSDFIIPALKKLQNKYPDLVEVKIVYKLSLDDYIKIMHQANIIVDQCYSYSYGMNAIEAMAMGKVVLSGNVLGNAEEFGEKECPIININADIDEICKILDNLINNIDRIRELSQKSREYALKVHSCRIVAQQYIDLFLNKV